MHRWSKMSLFYKEAIFTVACLVLVNVVVWVIAVILTRSYPWLAGSMAVAYTLGLRHAVDADHLATIDNVTRKIMYQQQRHREDDGSSSSFSDSPTSSVLTATTTASSESTLPSPPVCVGLFFSLGHSTIVIVASLILAATATALKDKFDAFGKIGGIIGTSVSAAFLFLIGFINLIVLIRVGRELHQVHKTGEYHYIDPVKDMISTESSNPRREQPREPALAQSSVAPVQNTTLDLTNLQRDSLGSGTPPSQDEAQRSPPSPRKPVQPGGLFARLFRPLFNLVDRSWKMYPLGLLFGLGFDTATQVGLLGITAMSAHAKLPMGVTLIFPALFTAAMSLVDTLDGILMANAYGWAFINPVRKLWYNFVITFLGVLVALIVGMVQLFSLLAEQLQLQGKFWDFFTMLADHLTLTGYIIIGLFVVTWVIAVLVYRCSPLKKLAQRVVVVQHAPAPILSGHPPPADLEKGSR